MADSFSQLAEIMKTKTDEEIAKFYFDMMAKNPEIGETAQRDRRRLAYNHILENFMINNLELIEKAVQKGKKPKNSRYPIGSISISNIDMKIGTPRHLFMILNVITKMVNEMAELQKQITKEMDSQSIPEEERISVHYHVVGGEVADFELE